MIRSAAFAVVLCVAAAALADGGDDQPRSPAAKPATPAKADEGPAGFKASVKLANGHSMDGVIRAAGTWERKDKDAGWTPCGKDDLGASVRLWYVSGGDGSLVISAKNVQSVEIGDPVSDSDIKKYTGQAAASEKRADEERERLRKERAEKKAAEAKAAAEAKKTELTPEEKKAAEAKAAAEKRAAELLAKFPPKDWGPDRRDAIQKRTLILHVMPTKEEREFLDNFADWSKAAADKAAADAAAKAASDKSAGTTKPDAPKSGDDKKSGGK